MNALDILKDDHDRISQLFDRIDQASDFPERRNIFTEIKRELDLHTRAEETEFYPLFAKREGFQDLIEQSYDDHEEIKDLLQELDGITEDERFSDRIDDLIAAVDDHIEEEESELFSKVENVMSDHELEELGSKIEKAKRGAAGIAA